MRHWNKGVVSSYFFSRFCFYPTYEALKLIPASAWRIDFISFYPTYEALKLIFIGSLNVGSQLFLPYLWGIETQIV